MAVVLDIEERIKAEIRVGAGNICACLCLRSKCKEYKSKE